MNKVRVLVAGCGNMGSSHARAYNRMKDDFEIVGIVDKFPENRGKLAKALGGLREFDDFDKALAEAKPDAVSINTYPDSHAALTKKAFEAGCHVFCEKPIATNIADAEEIASLAKKYGRKLVIGYILRHHPSWKKFVEVAHTLGKPLVMRMNLNQQSKGAMWTTHKNLMNAISPIVDCGVHYVDMMCLMTQSKPVRVQAMGARLSPEINENMYNYGQLQVFFEDGSVGWYEAGWGPMMSETAYFVKDVVGPNGCVTIVSPETAPSSDNIDSHTKTNKLRVHYAELGKDGSFVRKDDIIDMAEEPVHDDLCCFEQAYFLKAIRENIDLSQHVQDAVNSLKIVLAADRSVREKRVIDLQ